MKVLDEGHKFELLTLDGNIKQVLTFVKRNFPPEKYPGNTDCYPGTTMQDVYRCLSNRLRFLDNQKPNWVNKIVLQNNSQNILLLEQRHAISKSRQFTEDCNDQLRIAEFSEMCKICGHVCCIEHIGE